MLLELYFLNILLELSNGLPTSNTVLVNVNNTGTWNDAYQICCNMNGRMVQPDTEYKLEQLLNKRAELDLYPEFWVGIYDSNPGAGRWVWQDGSPVIYPNTSHEQPSVEQNCIRYKVTFLSDKTCDFTEFQIICEVKRGECGFDKLQETAVSHDLSPVITLSIELEKCLKICLWFVIGTTECSGIVYDDDNQTCSLYTTDIIPLASYTDYTIIPSKKATYYKDCFSVEKIYTVIDNHRYQTMAETVCYPQNDPMTTNTEPTTTESTPAPITISACPTTIIQSSSTSTETVVSTVCPTSVEPPREITSTTTRSTTTTTITVASSSDSSCPSQIPTTTVTETFCSSAVTTTMNYLCQTTPCSCEYTSSFSEERHYTTSIESTLLETSFSDQNIFSSTFETQTEEFSEIYRSITDVAKENILDVHNLSSYKRRFISVQDNRPSAITIGVGGSICIVAFFLAIIICDLRCKTITRSDLLENKETNNT